MAIACLVREILNEGSFIHRIGGGEAGADKSNNMIDNSGNQGAGDISELQAPYIKVEGRRRESIKLQKEYKGKVGKDKSCCKKSDKCV